jgi:hypothetical protein
MILKFNMSQIHTNSNGSPFCPPSGHAAMRHNAALEGSPALRLACELAADPTVCRRAVRSVTQCAFVLARCYRFAHIDHSGARMVDIDVT